MARTLETLDLGTSVYCGEERVGDVRGLYAEGTARSVEWLVVNWRGEREVALPAVEVENVDDRGVTLMHSEPAFYDDLVDFHPDRFPTTHKLA